MGIRYTKLPDCLDVDQLIVKSVRELYGTCPFCGEKKRVSKDWPDNRWLNYWLNFCVDDKYDCIRQTLDGTETYYRGDRRRTNSNKKLYTWVRMNFRCEKCGLEWQSDRYPTGLSTDLDIINNIMNMPLTGENSAMIAIQRDIRRMIGGQPKLEMKGVIECHS